MDPVALVLSALASGGAQGAGDGATDGVKAAYEKLVQLLSAKFSGNGKAEMILAEYASDPETYKAPLDKILCAYDVAADQGIIEAAQALLALLSQAESARVGYRADLRSTQGVQLGDHNQMFNNFYGGAPAATCELADGKRTCVLPAAGKCATCGLLMCASHSAGRNICSPCQQAESRRQFEIFEGLRPPDESPGYRRARLARERIQEIAQRLARDGMTPGPTAGGSTPSGRGLAGRFRRAQPSSGPVSGWDVGEYGWEVPNHERRSDSARTWKIARAFVAADGRLMMEGGHFCGEGGLYNPFMPGPFKTAADTINGEPELWEDIAQKMTDLARAKDLNIN